MAKFTLFMITLAITSIFAIPAPQAITKVNGGGIISANVYGGKVAVNNSFGSSATSYGTTSNYATNTGVASGPNSSFSANSNTAASTMNTYSNAFSSGLSAINGATGSNINYRYSSTPFYVQVGSTSASGSKNGLYEPASGTSYVTGTNSGISSGNGAFGASNSATASQASIFGSSGAHAVGTAYGTTIGRSVSQAGNDFNALANQAASIGTSNNYGNANGFGTVRSGTNFNAYAQP